MVSACVRVGKQESGFCVDPWPAITSAASSKLAGGASASLAQSAGRSNWPCEEVARRLAVAWCVTRIYFSASRQLVVIRMVAIPVPHKDAIMERPDSPIVDAKANIPLPAADLLEVQRGVERELAPKLIVLPCERSVVDRQTAIELPKPLSFQKLRANLRGIKMFLRIRAGSEAVTPVV